MPVQPAAGSQPADNLLQNPPIPTGQKRLIDLIKIPSEQLFPGLGQILFLASVVVVLLVSTFFLGVTEFLNSKPGATSQKQVGEFVAPINVAEVNFPSDFQRDIFLKNFQDAAKTGDYSARYKLLENDYIRLLGFYSADHDPKTRKVLEQYSQYMVNNYPDQAQKSVFTIPCYDSSCGTAKHSQELTSIKGEIYASSVIGRGQMENLDKDFEAAALSGSKDVQFSYYEQIFQSIKGSYEKTKDENLRGTAIKLRDFIKANYVDLFNVYSKNKSNPFDI